MRLWTDIKQNILEKGKIYFLFAFVLLLCGCGEECPTIQAYISAGIGNNCLLCTLFNTMADAAVKAADISWKQMAKPLGQVVIIVTAVYIALYTLKPLSSFGKQDVADYLTGDKSGVLTLLFKATVIFALLDGFGSVDSQWFIRYILNPILQSGIEIGQRVSNLNTGGGFKFNVVHVISDLLKSIFGTTGPAWQETFDMLKDTVNDFNDRVYKMIALGQSMICNATHGKFLDWYYLMLLYGFIYFIFGWIMLAGAGLYMIDIGITLGIAAILLPVGIASAISDWTVSYTKNLWNQFLNVFFSFIILGIIISLSLELVYHCAGMAATPDTSGNTFNLQQALDANDAKSLSEYLWSSGSLLLTILCFALIVQLMDQMKGLADKLSGGAGFSGASEVGGDVTKPVISGAKKAGSWAGTAAVNKISHSIGKTKRAQWIQRKYTSFRGRVFGIGPEGYKFWLRRR